MTGHFKLARTIADLAECEDIQSARLAEALHAAQSTEAEVQDYGVIMETNLNLMDLLR